MMAQMGIHRRRRLTRVLGLSLLMGITVLAYQNCGTDFVPRGQLGLSEFSLLSLDAWVGKCETDFQKLFTATYHPVLRNQCSTCHSPGGQGKGSFSSSDANVAFNSFQLSTSGFRDFTKFTVNATTTGHAPGYSGPENTSTFQKLQTIWEENPAACGSAIDNLGSQTSSKTIQAGNQNRTISWDLDSELEFGEGNYGGARLSIQVRTTTDRNSGKSYYYFVNPTLTTGSSPLQIGQIMIIINNQIWEQGTTYSRLDLTVAANTNNEVLSSATIFVEYPVANTDEVAISIGQLKVP